MYRKIVMRGVITVKAGIFFYSYGGLIFYLPLVITLLIEITIAEVLN